MQVTERNEVACERVTSSYLSQYFSCKLYILYAGHEHPWIQ